MTTPAKIDTFKESLQSIFPGLAVIIAAMHGNTENNIDVWNSYHFNVSPENLNFSKSPYYYKKSEIVHFTSIPALISILQEKSIRLYNLHSLNDPREFTFASKYLSLTEKLVEDARDNIYLMSFCETQILEKATDEFTMWRLYGNQGKGVSIVFSVANDPRKWNDFHLSQVYYGDDNRVRFKEIFELLTELNVEPPVIELDLGKLYSFHKSNLFLPESEVRLLYDRRKMRTGVGARTLTMKDEVVFPILRSDLLKLLDNNDKVEYLQIPIYQNQMRNSECEIPLLRIEEIQIGYQIGTQIDQVRSAIERICKETLGYAPKINQTRLRDFYNGSDSTT